MSFAFPSHSGAARSMMRAPKGAMASTVSAAERAMTTVPEGTLCAPMAPRTICSTVEIFTKDVSVMKTNGKRETSASATTSASGRLRRLSTELCMAGIAGAAACDGEDSAFLAPRHLRQNVGKAWGSGPCSATGTASASSSPSRVSPPSDAPTTYTSLPTRTRYTARRASSGSLPMSSRGPLGRPKPSRRPP